MKITVDKNHVKGKITADSLPVKTCIYVEGEDTVYMVCKSDTGVKFVNLGTGIIHEGYPWEISKNQIVESSITLDPKG